MDRNCSRIRTRNSYTKNSVNIDIDKIGDIDLIIIVLIAKDNRLETLKPLMIEVNQALESLNQGDVIYIE
ncbi:hypothetical protein [Okeania sp. SIO1I7]|uniref:hypothetical protein n=1 Tax=Okeania sp. SIO1I7 TaxID=2607772 RepID=UPI0025F97B44|nr:hypothetical protein [Okeania sp. SIO1I7]